MVEVEVEAMEEAEVVEQGREGAARSWQRYACDRRRAALQPLQLPTATMPSPLPLAQYTPLAMALAVPLAARAARAARALAARALAARAARARATRIPMPQVLPHATGVAAGDQLAV